MEMSLRGKGKKYMKSTRTGLERFNSKYSKEKQDERAIKEKQLANSDNNLVLEELKKAGNIREAAVVFSREGMGLFADMFGNTMERIVSRVVESKVESIIERKMIEMMQGMAQGIEEGMQNFAENMLEGFDIREENDQKQVDEDTEELSQAYFEQDVRMTNLSSLSIEKIVNDLAGATLKGLDVGEKEKVEEIEPEIEPEVIIPTTSEDLPYWEKPYTGPGTKWQGDRPRHLSGKRHDLEEALEYYMHEFRQYPNQPIELASITRKINEALNVAVINSTLVMDIAKAKYNVEKLSRGVYIYRG